MLTSNIFKKEKGDFKDFALQIFAKVTSVLGFQRISYHQEGNENVGRNITLTQNFGIEGEGRETYLVYKYK